MPVDEIYSFLSGGGEMGALMRAKDWASHPLGKPDGWPQPLKTMVRMALTTQHPIFVFWGPELFCFYNDGYRASIRADKHPAMLGARGADMWREIWHIIGPQIEMVMRGEGATWHENALVPIYRDDVLQDVYWTYSYGPIDDPAGRNGVGGVLVICTETTEQIEVANKLALEKENFSRLFEQSPSFMTLLSGSDHVYEMANPEYMKLVGHRQLIGQSVADALPEAAAQGYVKILDEVFSSGIPYRAFGARFTRQDKPGGDLVERYVDFVYQPILGAEGTVTSIFVEGIDVTERHEADNAMRVSEERLRFLDKLGQAVAASRDADDVLAITTRMVAQHLHLSNCAYADMDPDEDGFTIRGDWAAPGSPNILGHYSLKDFGKLAVQELSSGRPLIINDNLSEIAPEEAATFQAIGIAATICMPLVKDGKLTALMAIHDNVPHQWSDEELTLIREVTERSWAHIERVRSEVELMQSREELRRANENLESAIVERTGELMAAEEALRHSQKLEAVGQLAGGLAHDFNNLLAGILGSLDVMKTRLAQGRLSEIDRYLTAAAGAAKRGASLTQRMLAFSRRQTLDPKPTDVNRLVASMEELVRRSVGPAITVETVSAAGLWPTLVDAGQLENALLNLCINGRDAMPQGGKLTIETANLCIDDRAASQRSLAPGQYISLCVSDTGMGMPPDVLARAFDPFYTTKPTGEGTGLGLSMVWGFAGQSGGSARIYSEVDKGTMVCIYLPRHAGEIHAEEISRPGDLPVSGGHQTVLLVDDEPLIRMIAAEQLQELGYAVVEAGDAREALKVLESSRRIELLVTDVGLPHGMNGRQLADAARTTRPGLPVLFITGYAENAVLNHGHLEAGMQVMTKPFDMDTFARRVKTLAERK
jgi:signal transduction histidine kinase/PAS domain-containing protein/ActR/RegA family two-component response regulator